MTVEPTITTHAVRDLLDVRESACVSITMPAHHGGPDTREDRIRLRNLIDEAERRMHARGAPRRLIDDVLGPARDLDGHRELWAVRHAGLAVYCRSETTRAVHLHHAPATRVDVAHFFAIRPLLHDAERTGICLLLTASRHRVALFRVGPRGVEPIALPGAPPGLPALVEPEAGSCRAVAEALRGALRDRHEPLVPAGEGRTIQALREACSYPHITAASIQGNPDHLSPEALAAKARAIVQRRAAVERRAAIMRVDAELAGPRGTERLAVIAPAAALGLVEILVVDPARSVFGSYDDGLGTVLFHDEPLGDDCDLVELALVETLRHGGSVHVRDDADGERTSPVAALLRPAALDAEI